MRRFAAGNRLHWIAVIRRLPGGHRGRSHPIDGSQRQAGRSLRERVGRSGV